jgi:transcription elongation factor Elf1
MFPERRTGGAIDIPLVCPRPGCTSNHAAVVSLSTSIATLRCLECGFAWAIEVIRLTDTVRRLVIAERRR